MYEFVCITFRFSGAKVRIFPKTAKPRALFFCKKINSRTKSRETLHLASAIFRFQGTSRPSATDPAPLFKYALSRHALRFFVSHCALRFSAGNKFPRLPVASHSPSAAVPSSSPSGSLSPISPICPICPTRPICPINKKPLEIPLEGLPAKNGGYLLSHGCAVPSARAGLTSLFGMGRGGTPPL